MKKSSVVLIISLSLITAWVRAYKLPQSFLFAEDQEDLSMRVKQIVIDRKLTLLSAKFSTPGLYLGPGYLYFLIPFFVLTDFHPQAAIITVVFLATLTGIFLFLAGKQIGGVTMGLMAWLLYLFWPTLHIWDRIFWNPNLILPGTSLVVLSLSKIYRGRNRWIWPLAIGLAATLQSHPQGILLTLVILLCLIMLRKKISLYPRHWLILLGSLFLSISPLLLFELRHGFVITQGLLQGSTFVFRPYYLLFVYPSLLVLLGWLLTRAKTFGIVILSLFLIKNIPIVLTQPQRPDGLQHKLAATRYALDLAKKHNISRFQFQTNSEGFRYLFWYLQHISHSPSQPLAFYESWDTVPNQAVIIQSSPPKGVSTHAVGTFQVEVKP